MKCKTRFVLTAISSLLICCGLSLSCSQHSYIEEPAKSNDFPENKTSDFSAGQPKEVMKGLFYVGIKDPAGKKSVWGVSRQSAKSVEHILAAYPYETEGCTNFYAVSDWKDTSILMEAFSQDLSKLVWSNYKEISKLKSRIEKLEKKQSERVRNKDVRIDKNQ